MNSQPVSALLDGRVFVYHGSASGLSGVPDWTAESNQPVALFGVVVARAGDVNRDGFDDVVIGASQYDAGESDEGAAFVFLGSGTGLSGGGARLSGTPQTGRAQPALNGI